MAVKVLEGNRVEHDGKPYEAGEVISDISDKEAEALLKAGVVGDANAKSTPSAEEVAQTAEEAGQTSEQKKGLFR